ncbi:MAG: glycosyltransferase [Patescibacteria group bacterium]|nr:glycosyltransferase [Patescibacteria group bacterium]
MIRPRLSVLLPVYNGQAFVSEAIDSVLSQTLEDFELLVLDDGSSDGSCAICREWAARDRRVTFLRDEHRGLVARLNGGLSMAQGEFVARMDADDVALASRFEQQVQFLGLHPECVAVGSQVALIDADGDMLTVKRLPLEHGGIDRQLMRGRGDIVCHPAAMFRKEAVLRIGGYREQFRHAEDLDLFLRLAEVGRLSNLPTVLLKYRQHLDSICHKMQDQQQVSVLMAVREAIRRRGLPVSLERRVMLPRRASTEVCRSRWAQWALYSGRIGTARKHLLRLVASAPTRVRTYVLAGKAVLPTELAFGIARTAIDALQDGAKRPEPRRGLCVTSSERVSP